MSKKEIEPKEDHSRIYELGNKVARSSVAVIDTIVQRGGFKGEEMSTIGALRDQAVQIIQICEEYQSAQGVGDE